MTKEFDELRCPICGFFHSLGYWFRLTPSGRPSSVARTRISLGRAKGFKTVKSFEDYRFFWSGFDVIRNLISDTLKWWLNKRFLTKTELKLMFADLFREERVKLSFLDMYKGLQVFVWKKKSPYHEGYKYEVGI